jgi:predicted nucleic acid-binding protein
MAARSRAYVDSSAFISFLDSSDRFHLLFSRLFSDPPQLLTTALVINETHAWFLRRYDIYRGLRFLSFVQELEPLVTISVGREELEHGEEVLRRFNDQELTLVDGVGLALMKSKRIKVCWSTDRHMRLLGSELAITNG